MTSLRGFVLAQNFALQGLAATVTTPGGDAITTRVIWLTTEAVGLPGGLDIKRRDPRRLAALRRDQVATVPLDTVIVAPEEPGGDNKTWKVSGYDGLRADQHRVVVVPA